MPVEILTASQRTEWERFPEEIDEASLTAFFSYADDELEQIAISTAASRSPWPSARCAGSGSCPQLCRSCPSPLPP
ncbi:MAG: hypothetical protein LC790_04900 [Actinobacteria bacterium]|nr:hypothetical protein [Actinomycetota bacterium]